MTALAAEMAELKAELKAKEGRMRALEKELGVTRLAKIQTAVRGGVSTTGHALGSLGGKIKAGSMCAPAAPLVGGGGG